MRQASLTGLAVAMATLGWGAAQAGVIAGTGAEPSASQLGATDAVALAISDSGPGHALVVPYFTAQNGQASVLHLVNTDLDNGKAVKLRWRDAGNGDYLLSLQVLLAPGDAWTAAVTQGPDGVARISTADQSCTYPRLAPGGAAQPFSMHRLNPADAPDVQRLHTREGTVEAIVMADIPAAPVYGAGANARSALFNTIRMSGGLSRCDLEVLDDALLTNTSSEPVAAGRGLATPTGGLTGSWYIIDAPGSTAFSGAATAIQAVDGAGRPARGNFVLFPQSSDDVTAPEFYTADPLLASGGHASRTKRANGLTSSPNTTAAVRAKYYDLPDLSTPYYLPTNVANARATAGDITRLLSVKSVSNQYATDSAISARTDWVLSMPTRRYSVGIDYSQQAPNARLFSVVPPANGGDNQYFHSGNTSVESVPVYATVEGAPVLQYARPRKVCGPEVPAGQLFADREANILDPANPGDGIRPAVMPFGPSFCGAVSVVAFSDTGASALGASVARQTAMSPFANGWSRLPTADASTPLGLPLLGAAYTRLGNPGARAGYGISWPHNFTR